MYPNLTGTGVALITPFTRSNHIDFKALYNLINMLIDHGVDYLVLLGTTGESPTISQLENEELLGFVKSTNAGRLPLVLGVGGNNTKALVCELNGTDFEGIDAILSVSPYYNKPKQAGIIEHYKAIADASSRPVIMYNIPGRTGSLMLPETTLKLAEHQNIMGTKEASGSIDIISQVLKDKPADFYVISGDDNLSLPLISLGADGVISVVANVLPALTSEMIRLALVGNFEEARKLHYQLYDFVNLLFADGSPGGAKAALSSIGLCNNYLRLPLVPVSPEHRQKIVKLYKQLLQN